MHEGLAIQMLEDTLMTLSVRYDNAMIFFVYLVLCVVS
jgi:hypothetical protein